MYSPNVYECICTNVHITYNYECTGSSMWLQLRVYICYISRLSTKRKSNTAKNTQVQSLRSILVPKPTCTRREPQYIAKSHPRAKYCICRITLVRTYQITTHGIFQLILSSINKKQTAALISHVVEEMDIFNLKDLPKVHELDPEIQYIKEIRKAHIKCNKFSTVVQNVIHKVSYICPKSCKTSQI